MKIRRLLFLIPIAIMVLIFMFSSQNGKASLNLSDGFIYNFISGFCNMLNIEFISIDALTLSLRTLVRKAAHFSIYALLGCSCIISIRYNLISLEKKHCILISQLACVLYAISDEIHQMIIPGRNGNLFDILLDSAGAFVGIIITCLVIYRKNKLM